MAFDLARYQQRSAKLDLSGIAWDAVPRTPLSADAIHAIEYMMDIEGHTSIYLSELLVSKACMDPSITGFLHVWAYEEMFHSLALRRFLEAYGVPVADERQERLRRETNALRVRTTLGIMFASRAVDVFAAVYLTIGALNELTTLHGYHRLARRAGHPILEDLLTRIAKQERVHYAFYRSQAARLLENSGLARFITRTYLRRSYVAVGAGVKPQGDIDRLVGYLLDGPDGREVARNIDGEIGRLPGLRGLHLAERTLDRATTPGVGTHLRAVSLRHA